jgi:hypothetical protein
MFFLISPERDARFSNSYSLNSDLWLNTDPGWRETWNEHGSAFIKGYCIDRNMDSELVLELMADPTPRFRGSFTAVLAYRDGNVIVTHDRDRAYPLWRDSDSNKLGNIGLRSEHSIWADSWCRLNGGHCEQSYWMPQRDAVGQDVPMDQVVDQIYHRLMGTFSWLQERDHDPGNPICVFFSGGIDTLTCIAFLRHLGIRHRLITSEHFEYDHFTTQFLPSMRSISNYWGYTQVHHWRRSTVLVSGGMGDETFMRGPTTVAMMLAHMEKKISDILLPTDYHHTYFNRPKNQSIFSQDLGPFARRDRTVELIVDNVMNDHQHWHLGHTTTFTPFKDAELLRMVLSLSDDDLCREMADAQIQKQLIQRMEPALLDYLPPNKNDDISGIWRMSRDLTHS